jgi:hypothetical protein
MFAFALVRHILLVIVCFVILSIGGCGGSSSENQNSTEKTNSPPVITLYTNNITMVEAGSQNLALNVSDLDDEEISIQIESNNELVSAVYVSGSLIISTSEIDTDLDVELTIIATDKHQNTDKQVVKLKIINNLPPTMTISESDVTANENSTYSISLNISDPENDDVIVSTLSENNKIAISYSDGLITLTVGEFDADMNDEFSVVAVDSHGNKTVKTIGINIVDMTPEKRILAIGDSLTGGAYGAQYRTKLSNLSGLEVINLGIGGQTSTNIAARVGVLDVTITLDEPVIVDGSYLIQSIENTPLTSQGSQHVSCARYAYMSCEITRIISTGQMYINITGLTETLPSTFTLRMAHPEVNENDLAVIWVGRNNAYQVETVARDTDLIEAWLSESGAHYVILSVLNSGSEITGTSTYSYIQTINSNLSSTYPDNYLDIRSILVSSYDTTNETDVANYTGDAVPSSLRADAIHLNQDGHDIVANELYNWFESLGQF